MTAEAIGEDAVKEGGRIALYSGQPSEDCTGTDLKFEISSKVLNNFS